MHIFTGSSSEWNKIIAQFSEPHFLQTWEWSQVKAQYGWIPMPYVWRDDSDSIVAAVMILKKQSFGHRFGARLCILYSPKGPLMDWSNQSLRMRVLNDLQFFAKDQGAIFLKIDPDVRLGRGIPNSAEDMPDETGLSIISDLTDRGWRISEEQIQFKNTVLVELSETEEEILARMKSKTRYNIRLAEKKGVALRVGKEGDLGMLYRMYAETSIRDGFVIRDENYYLKVWGLFMANIETLENLKLPTCQPLIAEVDNEPVAAIFLFIFAGRAYYVYGMSRNLHREKMPTYLLQWGAMKRAKESGCNVYDLWGAPDVFDESDSMWGVYRFKEGLGGDVIRTLGAYDFAPNKFLYKLYTDIMPRVLGVMRSIGKKKTKQQSM